MPETALICRRFLSPLCVCVCVCVCVCACKCNVCECYSAVLVIRLTYTSTKTCIKNEWHDYGEYIYPVQGLCTFQVLFIYLAVTIPTIIL